MNIMNRAFFATLMFLNSVSAQTSADAATSAKKEEIVSSISKGEYLGIATVQGEVKLNKGKNNLVAIEQGAVLIRFKSPNGLISPIRFFRGDRVLEIRDQNNEFQFHIPKEQITSEGKISVQSELAKQNAHLTMEQKSSLVKRETQEGTSSCSYIGYCYTCAMGLDGKNDCGMKMSSSCSGRRRALYQYDYYRSMINLKIFNDSGAMEIRTNPKTEIESRIVKYLSSCG